MESVSKLDQHRFFRRRQSFEIGTDGLLRVECHQPFSQESWTTPLKYLDSNPIRVRRADFRPLILGLPFALIAIGCIAEAGDGFSRSDFSGGATCVVGAFIFAFAAAVVLWIISLKSVNVLTFSSSTGVNLPLWFNNPSPVEFEEFVKKFKGAIESARAFAGDSLEEDIKMLEQLLERGLLDQGQFESAKEKLLAKRDSAKIGF